MLSVETILFPTDFSEKTQQIFPVACSLARDCGARVVVLYVAPPPFGPEKLEARHRPDEYYHGCWSALHRMAAPDQNVRVEHRLEEGSTSAMIVEAAKDMHADLIVMGTHGRAGPGRLLFGSVAEEVLRKASCPVLTMKVPPSVETEEKAEFEATQTGPRLARKVSIKTILHPTDFSTCSDDAFRIACSLAHDYGAHLIALHVTAVPDLAYTGYGTPGSPLLKERYLTKINQDLENLQPDDPRLAFERRLEEGNPASTILRIATEAEADLIIMGTHGRSGLQHMLIGSIAEQVMRKALCPVLTLKTHEPEIGSTLGIKVDESNLSPS